MTLFSAIHAKFVTKRSSASRSAPDKAERRARRHDGRHTERGADRREHGHQHRAEDGARHDDRERRIRGELSGETRADLQRGRNDVGAGKDEKEIERRLRPIAGGNRTQLNTLHAT